MTNEVWIILRSFMETVIDGRARHMSATYSWGSVAVYRSTDSLVQVDLEIRDIEQVGQRRDSETGK